MAIIRNQPKKLNSMDIKLLLLRYYRRQGFFCCTEFNQMDIFGFETFPGNPKKKPIGVEIEIKISKADLIADKKKTKHINYGYETGYNHGKIMNFLANKFYYAVPAFLVEDAIKQCKELNNNYGVLEIQNVKHDAIYEPIVRKKARKFDFDLEMDKVWRYFAGRCSNEILTLREKINKII